jgi:hypothetical protein
MSTTETSATTTSGDRIQGSEHFTSTTHFTRRGVGAAARRRSREEASDPWDAGTTTDRPFGAVRRRPGSQDLIVVGR